MVQNYTDLLCDDPAEGARLGLLALMAGISEECWCAGWMMDNEFTCWKSVKSGYPQSNGQSVITARQALLLKLLSDEAGGWWIWDGGARPKFISLDKWSERLQSRKMQEQA